MKCPNCSNEKTNYHGESETLVGYASFLDDEGQEHHHDDNCQKRRYSCSKCKHEWTESIRRTCTIPDCDWKGKETCWCHNGTPKVDQWTDYPPPPFSLDDL